MAIMGPSAAKFVAGIKEYNRTLVDSFKFDGVTYKLEHSNSNQIYEKFWYITRVDLLCGNIESKSVDEITAMLNWIDLVLDCRRGGK